MSEPAAQPKDLATRVLSDTKWQLAWMLWLGLIITYVGVPIQRFLIVLWVRGSDAYYQQGIRALPGKPVKFSDGGLVTDLPGFMSGMIVFVFGIMIGLSLLLVFTLRFYDKHIQQRPPDVT
ncbi:MAG TPA: hypothetical protein VL527_05645 [Dongiaceae bacterium]|jgi:hypothetical protein|nr:hypothetical protein [Dongiaceae bacterium]